MRTILQLPVKKYPEISGSIWKLDNVASDKMHHRDGKEFIMHNISYSTISRLSISQIPMQYVGDIKTKDMMKTCFECYSIFLTI